MDNLSTYKEPITISSVQILMHTSHVQCERHGLNAQINVNTPKKDSEEIVKSKFFTSCLAFRSLIPTLGIYIQT